MSFGGLKLVCDPHLTEWVRRPILPKTKRKRIRRKWMRKYPQGAAIPKEVVYQMGDTLIVHPAIAAQLQARLTD